MNIDKTDKQALIKYRIEMSKEAINDAEYLIQGEKLKASVNRIYYASFYILSALALKYDFKTSKHHQLIGWFNKNFIKPNLVDKKYGDILKETFDSRTDSDYGDFISFSKEEVIALLNDTKDFVLKIESQILTDL